MKFYYYSILGAILFLSQLALGQPPGGGGGGGGGQILCLSMQYLDGTTCKKCSTLMPECTLCDQNSAITPKCNQCSSPYAVDPSNTSQCTLSCTAITDCTSCVLISDTIREIVCTACISSQQPSTDQKSCVIKSNCEVNQFSYGSDCQNCVDFGCGNRCSFNYFFKSVLCGNCPSTMTLSPVTRQCVTKTDATSPMCGEGYYPLIDLNLAVVCTDCGNGVRSCSKALTGQLTISSCYTDLFKYDGISICNAIVDTTCSNPDCKSCVYVNSKPLCTSCDKSAYLDVRTGTCVQSTICSSGEYLAISGTQFVCKSCNIDGCESCQYDYSQSIIVCTACRKKYTLIVLSNQCALSCGDQLYQDPITQMCLTCPLDCDECQNANYSQIAAGKCSICSNAVEWKNQLSDPTKPSSIIGVICYQDVSPKTRPLGYVLGYDRYVTERKILQCPDNCQSCDNNIEGYQVGEILCTACTEGYLLDNYVCNLDSGSTACARGSYGRNSMIDGLFRCFKCPKGCVTCQFLTVSNTVECDSCEVSYTLNSKKCQTTNTIIQPICSPIQYYGPTAQEHTCLPCPANCATCEFNQYQSSLVCQTCVSGYDFFNYKCILTCPSGMYWTPYYYYQEIDNAQYFKNSICRNCPSSCESCIFDSTLMEPICIACAPGFIKVAGFSYCVMFKQDCPTGFFLIAMNGMQFCTPCPNTCITCSLNNPQNPGTFECQAPCRDGNTLINGVCVKDLGIKPQCDESDQKTINVEVTNNVYSYVCVDCPSNCSLCSSDHQMALYCITCDSGYFLTPSKTCVSINSCGEGQYAYFDQLKNELGCLTCPYGTVTCALNNPTDLFSLNHITCIAGWTKIGKQCSTTSASSAICPESYYIANQKCTLCNEGCKICEKPADITSSPYKINCKQCHFDYDMNESTLQCVSKCQIKGQYWNGTECLPCQKSCNKCSLIAETQGFGTGTSKSDLPVCLECVTGYQKVYNPETQDYSCAQETKIEQNCPLNSTYDQNLDQCLCNSHMILSEDGTMCIDIISSLQGCPPKSYLAAPGVCLPCSVISGTCLLCNGPTTHTCQMCNYGYWANQIDGTCEQCDVGCESCEDAFNCFSCQAGTFRYQTNFGGMNLNQCKTLDCPKGYIYSLDSFLAQNSDQLYSLPDLLQTAAGAYLDEPTYQSQGQGSIAIINGISLYDKSQLPFDLLTTNYPIYYGVQVRVDCINCLANCNKCPSGNILNDATQTCLQGTDCPYPYIKSGSSCVSSSSTDSFYSTIILDGKPLGAYSNKKNVVARCQTSFDSNNSTSTTIKYLWSVVSVAGSQASQIRSGEIEYDGKQDTEISLPTDQATRLKSKLLIGLNLTEKRIIIPPINIQINNIYTLQCTATKDSTVSQSQKSFYSEELPLTGRSLFDVGVTADQFTISPSIGNSTETEFSITLSIGSQIFIIDDQQIGLTEAEKRFNNWYYNVEITPTSKLIKIQKWKIIVPFSSVTGVQKLFLPYVDVDTQVLFTLVVSRRDESYTLSQKVSLLKQTYSADNDEVLTKIASQLDTMTDAELATNQIDLSLISMNAMVKTLISQFEQFRLNRYEEKQSSYLNLTTYNCYPDDECSRQGVCTLQTQIGRYSCVCRDGFDGKNCQFKSEEVYSLVVIKTGLSRVLKVFDFSQDELTAQIVIDICQDLLSTEFINKIIVTNVVQALNSSIAFANNPNTAASLLQIFSTAATHIRDQPDMVATQANNEINFLAEIQTIIQKINLAIDRTLNQLVTGLDPSTPSFSFSSVETEFFMNVQWFPVPRVTAAVTEETTDNNTNSSISTSASELPSFQISMPSAANSSTTSQIPLIELQSVSEIICSLYEQESSYMNYIVSDLSHPPYSFKITSLKCFYSNGTQFLLKNMTTPLQVWVPDNLKTMKDPSIKGNSTNYTACNFITLDENKVQIGYSTEGCEEQKDSSNKNGAWCVCNHATKFTRMPITKKLVIIEEQNFDITYVSAIVGANNANLFTLINLCLALVFSLIF